MYLEGSGDHLVPHDLAGFGSGRRSHPAKTASAAINSRAISLRLSFWTSFHSVPSDVILSL
jgi:hypothetical protein